MPAKKNNDAITIQNMDIIQFPVLNESSNSIPKKSVNMVRADPSLICFIKFNFMPRT